MKNVKTILLTTLLAVALFGCGSDDDNETHMPAPTPPAPPPPAPTPETNVRVIHASPDAPTVNILAGDAVLGGLTGVDYQVASGWLTIDEAEYTINVQANLPAGATANVLSLTATLSGDNTYNVLAVGSVAGETLETLVISNAASAVTAGQTRVQVVHAAPNAPHVDIYVTAPDDDLDSAQPLATAAYKDATGQVEVAPGDYRIRITPMGSKTVVFDSGTVNLPADADLLIAATENVGAGSSPVTLLLADGTASSTIVDQWATADLRVVHGVADAPAVDVNANNALTLVDGAPFLATTAYISVSPGDYLIDIAADANNAVVIDDANVTLERGKFYTAIANGALASIDLDLLVDMPRKVATEAKVRIVHASPAAGSVDIYVTADGMIDSVDPAFSGVDYATDALAETGYVALGAGDYVVTVTPTGSKTKTLETGTLSLQTGEIYTAIAVDGNMAGDAPQLIVLDGLDATPPMLPMPNLRASHASADAPTVNVTANGDVLWAGVDYQMSSPWASVPADTYNAVVQANLPSNMTADVISAELMLNAGYNYDVVAIGSVEAGSLAPLVLQNKNFPVAYDNVRVQIVHGAVNAPEVDIYVTAPDADLAASSPVATASFGQNTAQIIVPASDYQIRITPAGASDVVFDSGSINLAAGSDLLVVATDSVAAGESPVSLLVADGSGSFVILDSNAMSHVRVVHAVADAPAVDVIANNALTLVDGAAFLAATDYLSVMPADYLLDIAADADGTVVVDDFAVTLQPGKFYTAIANNTLASIELDILADMPRPVATAAQVRIVHASPAAGEVDIYVTADGMIDAVDPAFTGVPYSTDDLAETGYVSLAAGDYVVTVTPTGSKTKALETGVLSLPVGSINTAIAVDGTNSGDAPQLILQDDLAPMP